MLQKGKFKLRGDLVIWIVFILLALTSIVEVYSAIGNEAFSNHDSPTTLIAKHILIVAFGVFCVYLFHVTKYTYISRLLKPALCICAVLIIIPIIASYHAPSDAPESLKAGRWIFLPFGFSFQPSEMAKYILIMYVAKELALSRERIKEKETFWKILIPIVIICGEIFPKNISTSLLLFAVCFILMFIGGIRTKYLLNLMLVGVACMGLLFVFTDMKSKSANTNSNIATQRNNLTRLDTGVGRIKSIFAEEQDLNMQIKTARMAIGSAGLLGRGFGLSRVAWSQPEAHNDYIYTTIVEEGGFAFGFFVLLLYMVLLYRMMAIAKKAKGYFGAFVCMGIGIVIVLQALIHMVVAVGFPIVTGQTLPFISSGGTSYIFVCAALGIVLNISSTGEKGKDYEEDLPSEELSNEEIPSSEGNQAMS
jgi:cell division protein FtsW